MSAHRAVVVSWLVLGAGLAACGGDKSDSAATVASFDSLSDSEKAAFMASDVLPTMAAIFQAYDADAHADFSCASCHVTGVADGSYAMPDPGLPELSEAAFPYTEGTGLFMEEEVLPAMRDLLGPTDGGRGCTTCHTVGE